MTGRWRRRIILVLCGALWLAVLAVPPAQAHTGFYPVSWVTEYEKCSRQTREWWPTSLARSVTGFFPVTWRTEYEECSWHNRDMEWWATGPGWSAKNQQRITDAQARWNAISTNRHTRMRFNGTRSMSADPCRNGYNNNGHRFAYSKRNWLGLTRFCVTASDHSKMHSVMITYNTRYRWYSGTGKPYRTRYDLLSVMVHELGHSTGFMPHFTDARSCPTPWSHTARQTMCSGVSPGSIYKRSPGAHDIHAFRYGYR